VGGGDSVSDTGGGERAEEQGGQQSNEVNDISYIYERVCACVCQD
jgi:hypothetical protein